MKRLFIVLCGVLALGGLAAPSYGQDVKIAVAAMGPDVGSEISEVAGRAPYFLFFDSAGKLLEARENTGRTASGGAGRDTADLLNKKKATVFVAGHVGPKMKKALDFYKIQIQEQTGVANDAVQEIIKGN